MEEQPKMCRKHTSIQQILYAAASSARFCLCEGQSGMQPEIFRCLLCGHTTCSKCRGNPQHVYGKLERARIPPERVLRMLTEALPVRLFLRGFSDAQLNRLKPDEVNPKLWTAWRAEVACLDDAEFRLRRLQRAQVWHACGLRWMCVRATCNACACMRFI